ncbi:MAG: hypothetical protein H0V09_09920, partial [Gemmatimonadetes bacterium]|nr:hypothetical protein [Gemmatimonadota bacterium]
MSRSALRSFLMAAPKAEVHIHLEGAVSRGFLEERAALHRLPWVGHAADELRRRLGAGSLEDFFQAFRWVLEGHFRTPGDYVAGLRDVATSLRQANIRYAELSVSAGALLFFDRPLREILDALTETADVLQVGGGPEVRLVADGVRQHGPAPLERVLRAVLESSRAGEPRWVALGLAGVEASRPAAQFA